MNSITLVGRLAAEPETRSAEAGLAAVAPSTVNEIDSQPVLFAATSRTVPDPNGWRSGDARARRLDRLEAATSHAAMTNGLNR